MKSTLLRQLKQTLPPAPVQPTVPAPEVEAELDEATLFAQATQGAKRLHAPPPPPRPSRPLKLDAATQLRRQQAEGSPELGYRPLSDTAALMAPVAPEATLAYKRSGVQDRQFDQLRTGKLPWRHAVDLHGCTLDQARDALLQLLEEARVEGINVVKVVHGKGHINGQALLKTAVNGWLRQMPEVLAFSSADARNGGTGAVMVLLKRPRGDRSDP